MDKLTLVFRGGCPDNITEGIETILNDVNLQDHVFIADVKTHSVEILAVTEVRSLISRLQGKYALSIIQSHLSQLGHVTVCFGKLQDGSVVKTMQNQATGLFK